MANATIDRRIIENVAAGIEIRCGERDRSAPEHQLDQQDDELVLLPERMDHEAGLALGKDAVLSALKSDAHHIASRLGRVRDLRLGHVNVESLDARTWLYPIYAGRYDYEGYSHLVEVDGITGKVYVEVPRSVSSQRMKHRLKIALYVAIPMIIALVVILAWQNRDYLAPQPTTRVPEMVPPATAVPVMPPPATLDAQSDTLDASYTGRWTGWVNQPEATQRYSTILTLANCKSNEVCGTVVYPELSCGGELTYLYREADRAVLLESITFGNCVQDAVITLEQTDGELWKAIYYWPRDNLDKVRADAILEKTN
jgi:hypothetical protein